MRCVFLCVCSSCSLFQHRDRMRRITRCCIFRSWDQQHKPKITRSLLALHAETEPIFRHNLMHLCCLETNSDNMFRFCLFSLISLETGQLEVSLERISAVQAAAEFTYSHLSSSIIFISASCCDDMKSFAYYVRAHVCIVFKFEVIANVGGLL